MALTLPFEIIDPLQKKSVSLRFAPLASKETAMQTPSNHLEAMFCKAPAACGLNHQWQDTNGYVFKSLTELGFKRSILMDDNDFFGTWSLFKLLRIWQFYCKIVDVIHAMCIAFQKQKGRWNVQVETQSSHITRSSFCNHLRSQPPNICCTLSWS